MRVFCAAMLVLSVGLYATYDRFVKGATADTPSDRLKELTKRFNDESDELVKRFEKASTAAEQKGVLAEGKELATLTAEKVRKIAEEDPKSETAFQAATFTVNRLVAIGASGPDVDKILAIASEHHLNNAGVKDLVLTVGRAGASGEKFLITASEKSKDKEVRAISLYILGMSAGEQSEDAPNEKVSTELVNKAVDFLTRAAKESPDTKVDGDKISTIVEAEIKSIKMLAIGSPVPEVKGTELRDQKKQSIADYRGKVVLLDMWFTGCPPCREMIPHEREMVKRLEGRPFKLISVSTDEKKKSLTNFLDKNPMPWVHWWDDGEESPLIATLKVRVYPTIYLIDAKGVIRRKWVGMPNLDALDKAVEDLVKEAEAKK